ncbi:MAG: tyrosine-type recombinase/integrase [Desulfobacterales bacterium]
MKVSKVIEICLDYHRNHSKPNTVRSYEAILTKFGLIFGDKDLEEAASEDILTFLSKITDDRKQQTSRTRYSHLAAFFNFLIRNIDERIQNPCANQLLWSIGGYFPYPMRQLRSMVKKAGEMAGIRLRPHDLRRHAATYASRSGVPIEIVSKIILRHSNLSTTQMYLGKVSDNEAMRWIENLYA